MSHFLSMFLTGAMLADLLTKPLLYKLHAKFAKGIMQGMFSNPNLTSKGSVNYLNLNKYIDTRCQVQRMEQIQKDSRTMQDSQVLKKIPKFCDSSRSSPLDDDATAWIVWS